MVSLSEIEKSLAAGESLNDVYDSIQAILKNEPDNSSAWCLLGGVFRRKCQWEDAINAYNHAKLIDPEGPADAAIESIYESINNTQW